MGSCDCTRVRDSYAGRLRRRTNSIEADSYCYYHFYVDSNRRPYLYPHTDLHPDAHVDPDPDPYAHANPYPGTSTHRDSHCRPTSRPVSSAHPPR
jgi:hypothetical protein